MIPLAKVLIGEADIPVRHSLLAVARADVFIGSSLPHSSFELRHSFVIRI
jgi:hypothetical protein